MMFESTEGAIFYIVVWPIAKTCKCGIYIFYFVFINDNKSRVKLVEI